MYAIIYLQMTDQEVNVGKWLDKQLNARGMVDADLAREAGVDSGTISNARTRNKVGVDLSKKFAKAFKMKHVVVMYELGITDENPNDPTQNLQPLEHEILYIVHGRPESQQEAAWAAIKALFDSFDRGKNGTFDTSSDSQPSKRSK
jgi:hypothetical protein